MNFKVLKNKNLALLLMGKLVSMLGSNIQAIALSLYVFSMTGSVGKFSSVLALGIIPKLILGPFAGIIADRFDRKKIIVILDMLSGVIVGGLAVLFIFYGELSLPMIYAEVIMLSIIETFFNPTIGCMIPSVVEKEELVDANSINSFLQSIIAIAAPVIGTLIYTVMGLLPVLIIDSISYILSSISEMFIKVPKDNISKEKFDFAAFKSDFIEGFRYVKSNGEILKLALLAMAMNFILSAFGSISIIYLVKSILNLSDVWYGYMQTALAVSMVVGSIIGGVVNKKVSLSKVFSYGSLIMGVSLGFIGIAATQLSIDIFTVYGVYFIEILLIVFIIITVVVLNIAVPTKFQKSVPNNMLGRAGSVLGALSSAASPLGLIIFGSLFDVIPYYICMLLMGSIMAISGVIYIKGMVKERVEAQISEV